MKNLLRWALVLPLMASVVMSCNKEDDDNPTPVVPDNPVEGKVLLFEKSSTEADLDIKVYVDENPITGYNKVYVMLYEIGTTNVVKDAKVTYEPEMMMMNHEHGCPVENPTATMPDDGLFEGVVYFQMPTSQMGDWFLDVLVENNVNNKSGTVRGEFTVMESNPAKQFSFLSPADGAKIFVSLVEPQMPDVGENVFTVAIHKKESMYSWPAVVDLKVEFKPWMPTMGHSSPFVNPIHTSMGHYEGQVNYTMTGLWYVYISIKDMNDNVLLPEETQYFEMTLSI